MNEMEREVKIPEVPDGADVYRSVRRVVTGLDDRVTGIAAVAGPDVEAGAVVELPAGALLMTVDQRRTGWKEPRHGGKPYPLMAATMGLWLVRPEGALGTARSADRPLWTRTFARAASAYGTAARLQISKFLARHPAQEGTTVREITPGRGRPNLRAQECRWCGALVHADRGVLTGRGEGVQVEHRAGDCPVRAAETGTACARCSVPVAPGTAGLVMVREDGGRWEVRHTGRCEGQVSAQQYDEARRRRDDERARERQRAVEDAAKKEKQATARRAKAAGKRALKRAAEKQAAEETRERVTSIGVARETGRTTLSDKGLAPAGERMRLVQVDADLNDGSTATWWDVEPYGGRGPAYGDEDLYEADERAGRFYHLPDARAEYQQHTYDTVPYTPPRRRAPAVPPCPSDGARHCDHCGSIRATGGWMSASLGLACSDTCLDAMSDARGTHASRHH
ncbi:hypothetical protein ACFXI8_26915 [Streptomyces niveus]|uniref:hypothetical protein n=1 Tax=Streptomyces niveus TaxID=193462 RepID=UPI0036B2DE51